LIPPSQSKVALATPITAISADRISIAKKRVAEHRKVAAGIPAVSGGTSTIAHSITETKQARASATSSRTIPATTTTTTSSITTTTTTTTTATSTIAPLSTSTANPSLNEFDDFDENISGACGF
jgi:hypothetical protein